MTELHCAIDEVDKHAWHTMLGGFRDSCLMQTWSYAAARWPNAKLSHVIVTRDGCPLAAAQVVLWTLPVMGGGFAHVHHGPVWQPQSTEADERALQLITQKIRNEYVDRRRLSLRVKPQVALRPADADAICRSLTDAGFRHAPGTAKDRFLVDLSPTLEELRSALHSKWRYNLKRAERHGLQINHVHGPKALERFMPLYDEMLARKAFVDNSAISELTTFYADLPESMTPVVLLCERGGEPVAGVVLSVIGDTALYVFGASGTSALKLNAGYLLQWFAVQWLRERGVRWYDLGGGIDNPGLRQFKAGLVGSSGSVIAMPGEFERHGGLASRAGVKVAFWGRGLLHALKRDAARPHR